VLFCGIVIVTASILRIYVTWKGTIVKPPDDDDDDDVEISKHVAVYII
jgi:hypothetical protein